MKIIYSVYAVATARQALACLFHPVFLSSDGGKATRLRGRAVRDLEVIFTQT